MKDSWESENKTMSRWKPVRSQGIKQWVDESQLGAWE